MSYYVICDNLSIGYLCLYLDYFWKIILYIRKLFCVLTLFVLRYINYCFIRSVRGICTCNTNVDIQILNCTGRGSEPSVVGMNIFRRHSVGKVVIFTLVVLSTPLRHVFRLRHDVGRLPTYSRIDSSSANLQSTRKPGEVLVKFTGPS